MTIKPQNHKYYEFEVTLLGTETKVYRKFLLHKYSNFSALHSAIQDSCGWENRHLYNFSFEKMNGETINLKDYKDKVLLIVNTASKCGFTNQYSGLEKLYKKYKDEVLVIISVPSNDFLNQEPGSDKDIQEFCKINYGVSFPVTKKQKVKGQEVTFKCEKYYLIDEKYYSELKKYLD
jgi:glutathione peroxidase-family protein